MIGPAGELIGVMAGVRAATGTRHVPFHGDDGVIGARADLYHAGQSSMAAIAGGGGVRAAAHRAEPGNAYLPAVFDAQSGLYAAL